MSWKSLFSLPGSSLLLLWLACAMWHSSWVCWRSWRISRSVAAFCFSSSLVRRVMASRPDWLRISAVLRNRRWRVDVLSGPGQSGLWAVEEGGEEDEEESDEEGGDGVWELEMDGYPVLWGFWLLCWSFGWQLQQPGKQLWTPLASLCCCSSRNEWPTIGSSLFSSSVRTLLLWLWPSLPFSLSPVAGTAPFPSGVSFPGWGAMRG